MAMIAGGSMGVYAILSFLSTLFGNPYSIWHEGSFDTAEQCAYYHFQKHGAEIGAANILEYIRKADHFRQKPKGAHGKRIHGAVDGACRYYKRGRYIDMAPDKRIISFGST